MASAKTPPLLAGVFDEISFVVTSIRSRGLKHYGRALGIAIACIIGARNFVYQSGYEKLVRIQMDLGTARATAQYADTYKELDQNLRIFAQRLPPAAQPEVWLLDSVRESMKSEGLVALSISPVQTQELRDFRFLTIQLTFNAKYGEVASWVARMEGNRQLLHVAVLQIQKGGDRIGENNVQATVSTLVPRGGAL